MDEMKRYAVYHVPRQGPFAARAAQWLGRDIEAGKAVPHFGPPALMPRLATLTSAPRCYGFHGTLRAPFRMARGMTVADLDVVLARFAAGQAAVAGAGLRIMDMYGFVALVPDGGTAAMQALAAGVVAVTEPFRAALNGAEIVRRRPDRLSPRQRALLDRWGYPFVMEEFRFHMTLTGPLAPCDRQVVMDAAIPHFAPVLPRPFVIADLCLAGEDAAGQFRLLSRHPLAT